MRSAVLFALILTVGCGASSGANGGSASGDRSAYKETGEASYYADSLHGRPTASGEAYNKRKYTAAHRKLAFGTKVRVTNLSNGRSVTLRVNDRGPFVDGRIIDVSRVAAEKLDFVRQGLAEVRVEEMK